MKRTAEQSQGLETQSMECVKCCCRWRTKDFPFLLHAEFVILSASPVWFTSIHDLSIVLIYIQIRKIMKKSKAINASKEVNEEKTDTLTIIPTMKVNTENFKQKIVGFDGA